MTSLEDKVRILSQKVISILQDIQDYTSPPSTPSGTYIEDIFDLPKRKSRAEIKEVCQDVLHEIRIFFDFYLHTKEGNIFFTWITKANRYETLEQFLVK